jgi:site-specific recombinase XerD
MKDATGLPALLEAFFLDRLMRERHVSPHTITSYRDTFRILLQYVHEHRRKAPADLSLRDLDAPLLGAFLDHLEKDRGNSARSRNVRLAAIHSFFRYAALHAPECCGVTQRVLAIPAKRYVRRLISFLTSTEIDALLAAPDLTTWSGRRDRALLLLAVRTGMRASEITGLRCENIVLHPSACAECLGKGRKQRRTPLRRETAAVLREWLRERGGVPSDPAFPTRQGKALGHDGLDYLLKKHLVIARRHCPSLEKNHITFHCLRHSLAMSLLCAGADRSVIALFLGHEQVETTSVYLHADMQLKEAALARTSTGKPTVRRYRPGDRLLAFLNGL